MPASKFMLRVHSYGLALKESGFYTGSGTISPVSSGLCFQVDGSKFTVGFTNGCAFEG
jgi:hypothetical protein